MTLNSLNGGEGEREESQTNFTWKDAEYEMLKIDPLKIQNDCLLLPRRRSPSIPGDLNHPTHLQFSFSI